MMFYLKIINALLENIYSQIIIKMQTNYYLFCKEREFSGITYWKTKIGIMRIWFCVVPSPLYQTSGTVSAGKIIVQCCQKWKRATCRRTEQGLASVSCLLLLHGTGSYGSCIFSVNWILGLEYPVERFFNTLLLCLSKEPQTVVLLCLTLAKLGCQPKYLSVKKNKEGRYAISEIHRGLMHTCLNSSIWREVVECAIRLEKHFKRRLTKITSKPSSQYFHSWLE